MTLIEILKNIWSENTGGDKLKYTLSAFIWQLRKRLKHRFVKNIHTGGVVSVHPFSAYSPIFYYKWPEANELKFIRRHCWMSEVIVDVGANVGLFSLHLIDCFKNFYLFEPTPSTFKALKETCNLNKSVSWNLFNIGISNTSGTLSFLDEGKHSGTNRFCNESDQVITQGNKILIDVDTLDNLIPKDIDNMILKVDVEGFEEKVFDGSHNLFSQKKVKLVVFERLGRTSLENIKIFFKKHNYVIFSVVSDSTISKDEQVISQPLINLFAVPAENFSKLQYKLV